jgi:hypothetical protein
VADDFDFDDGETLDIPDDLGDDELMTGELGDDNIMTTDFDADELAVTGELPIATPGGKKKKKKKSRTRSTVAVGDDDEEDGYSDRRDQSPVKNRGKSTSGHFLLWTFLLLAMFGGLGFAYYPAVLITMHLDYLAQHATKPETADSKNHVDLTPTRKFLLTASPEIFKAYEQRIKFYYQNVPLVAHTGERQRTGATRQIYGVRVMVQHVLCVFNEALIFEAEINEQSKMEKRNNLVGSDGKGVLNVFENMITKENPSDELFDEIAFGLKLMASSPKCVTEASELLGRLIKARKEVSHYRRQVLTKVLGEYKGEAINDLMLGLIKELQDLEAIGEKNDYEFGNDKDGPNRLLLATFLWQRFNADIAKNTEPWSITKELDQEAWKRQKDTLNFLVDLWLSDRDQRVRQLSLDNINKLTSPRGMVLWNDMLTKPGKENFNKRNLAITILRRHTGYHEGYDPYGDPNDENQSWDNDGWTEYLTDTLPQKIKPASNDND